MRKMYTFWMIGLPSSGKTTLASEVCKKIDLVHLDSDEIRSLLITNPSFKQEETEIVYRCLISTSCILNNNGHDVIVSATTHLEKYKTMANTIINNCKNIYIDCPLDVCESRDVKGLYEKSRKGLITTFPIKIIGRNEDYMKKRYKIVDIFEPPKQFDLLINTSMLTLEESINALKNYIEKIRI